MEQQPKHSRKDYLTLFTSTFTLSAFTFGGGFVIIPLMRKKFVEQLHWIDEEEMMDHGAGHCVAAAHHFIHHFFFLHCVSG